MITNRIICGDAIIELPTLPVNSVDSIVTDPPAGISFMGKKWDDNKGGREQWIKWLSDVMAEGLRVLKPGGHALVWALPRTSHWTGFALENAGFEVRDIVHHLFGSGFPKSLSIDKAIDKMKGAERVKVIDERWATKYPNGPKGKTTQLTNGGRSNRIGTPMKELPTTPEAKEWEGWGTALKPAVECWWLVRKPLSEKTVAQNVLKWGTGGLNVDGCRVGTEVVTTSGKRDGTGNSLEWSKYTSPDSFKGQTHQGRFPANLIHDGSDEVLAEFAKTRISKSNVRTPPKTDVGNFEARQFNDYGAYRPKQYEVGHSDSGTPARFFYCAKPSKAERDAGLQGIKTISAGNRPESPDPTGKFPDHDHRVRGGNNHPTVKAQALMQYLIKLITPPGGIVLDPFAGSGSTLIAAKALGHPYIGIEIDHGYCEIAEKRLIADLNGNCSLDAFDDIGGR